MRVLLQELYGVLWLAGLPYALVFGAFSCLYFRAGALTWKQALVAFSGMYLLACVLHIRNDRRDARILQRAHDRAEREVDGLVRR